MSSNQLPASEPTRSRVPSAAVRADLDTHIDELEQRLVAREAWLRSTAESLAQRAQFALTPRPWVVPAVGLGALLWLGWRWRRRRNPAQAVGVDVPAIVAGRPVDDLAGLPWAGLTALGWPLAPAAWRERFTPGAAAAVVSTALVIGRRLLRRRIR